MSSFKVVIFIFMSAFDELPGICQTESFGVSCKTPHTYLPPYVTLVILGIMFNSWLSFVKEKQYNRLQSILGLFVGQCIFNRSNIQCGFCRLFFSARYIFFFNKKPHAIHAFVFSCRLICDYRAQHNIT